jgi:hypothetical protein
MSSTPGHGFTHDFRHICPSFKVKYEHRYDGPFVSEADKRMAIVFELLSVDPFRIR